MTSLARPLAAVLCLTALACSDGGGGQSTGNFPPAPAEPELTTQNISADPAQTDATQLDVIPLEIEIRPSYDFSDFSEYYWSWTLQLLRAPEVHSVFRGDLTPGAAGPSYGYTGRGARIAAVVSGALDTGHNELEGANIEIAPAVHLLAPNIDNPVERRLQQLDYLITGDRQRYTTRPIGRETVNGGVLELYRVIDPTVCKRVADFSAASPYAGADGELLTNSQVCSSHYGGGNLGMLSQERPLDDTELLSAGGLLVAAIAAQPIDRNPENQPIGVTFANTALGLAYDASVRVIPYGDYAHQALHHPEPITTLSGGRRIGQQLPTDDTRAGLAAEHQRLLYDAALFEALRPGSTDADPDTFDDDRIPDFVTVGVSRFNQHGWVAVRDLQGVIFGRLGAQETQNFDYIDFLTEHWSVGTEVRCDQVSQDHTITRHYHFMENMRANVAQVPLRLGAGFLVNCTQPSQASFRHFYRLTEHTGAGSIPILGLARGYTRVQAVPMPLIQSVGTGLAIPAYQHLQDSEAVPFISQAVPFISWIADLMHCTARIEPGGIGPGNVVAPTAQRHSSCPADTAQARQDLAAIPDAPSRNLYRQQLNWGGILTPTEDAQVSASELAALVMNRAAFEDLHQKTRLDPGSIDPAEKVRLYDLLDASMLNNVVMEYTRLFSRAREMTATLYSMASGTPPYESEDAIPPAAGVGRAVSGWLAVARRNSCLDISVSIDMPEHTHNALECLQALALPVINGIHRQVLRHHGIQTDSIADVGFEVQALPGRDPRPISLPNQIRVFPPFEEDLVPFTDDLQAHNITAQRVTVSLRVSCSQSPAGTGEEICVEDPANSEVADRYWTRYDYENLLTTLFTNRQLEAAFYKWYHTYIFDPYRFGYAGALSSLMQSDVPDAHKSVIALNAGGASDGTDFGVIGLEMAGQPATDNPFNLHNLFWLEDGIRDHVVVVVPVGLNTLLGNEIVPNGGLAHGYNACGDAQEYCLAAPGAPLPTFSYSYCRPDYDPADIRCNQLGNNSQVYENTDLNADHVAAAYVSSTLALMKERFGDSMSNIELLARLKQTAIREDCTIQGDQRPESCPQGSFRGYDATSSTPVATLYEVLADYSDRSIYGHGLINPHAALQPFSDTIVVIQPEGGAQGTAAAQSFRLKQSRFGLYNASFGDALQRGLQHHSLLIFDSLHSPFHRSLSAVASVYPAAGLSPLTHFASQSIPISPNAALQVLSLASAGNRQPEALNYRSGRYSFAIAPDISPAALTDQLRYAGPGNAALRPDSPWMLPWLGRQQDWQSAGVSLAFSSSRLNFSACSSRHQADSAQNPYDAGYASCNLLEYSFFSRSGQYGGTLGTLSEASGVLGLRPTGAAGSLSGSSSKALGLWGKHHLAGAVSLSWTAWRITADEQRSSGLLQQLSGLVSDSYAIALSLPSPLGKDDRLWLHAYQPLRLRQAQARLTVPFARTRYGEVILQNIDASLSPSGRERRFELAYDLPLTSGGLVQWAVGYTLEPNHIRRADSDHYLQIGLHLPLGSH